MLITSFACEIPVRIFALIALPSKNMKIFTTWKFPAIRFFNSTHNFCLMKIPVILYGGLPFDVLSTSRVHYKIETQRVLNVA